MCPRHCSTSASVTPGAQLDGEVPLAVADLAMKRGNVAMEAPAAKETGSVTPGEGAPSFVGTAASIAGSFGAITVSSEIMTTSSPLALLALSAGTTTSSAFLFRAGYSSLTTGGTLATVGWPIFFVPVLKINPVSKTVQAAMKDKGR